MLPLDHNPLDGLTYSSVDGHLGCSCFWATVNGAAVNICVQMFAWPSVLTSPGIADLWGRVVLGCREPSQTLEAQQRP